MALEKFAEFQVPEEEDVHNFEMKVDKCGSQVKYKMHNIFTLLLSFNTKFSQKPGLKSCYYLTIFGL